jgi:hypothetical protein
MRRSSAFLVTACCAPLLAPMRPARADVDGRARAAISTELDTNAERKEGESRRIDGATRFLARGMLAARPSSNQSIYARLDVGAKVFFRARSEDLFVTSGSLGYDVRFNERVALMLDGSVKDRRERVDETAYTLGAGGGGLRFTLSRWADLRVRAGYSRFVFRVDDVGFGHHGDDYSGELAFFPARRIRLAAVYSYARRGYRSNVFVADPAAPQGILSGTALRDDEVQSAELRLRFVRVVFFEGSYVFQWVRSNSYGFSFVRHRVAAQVSARLPLRFFVHVGGALQLLAFRDPIFLNPTLFIEDDNRNWVSLKVSRPLGRGFTLEARWSFYASGLSGDPLYYRRHVLGLGVAYAWPR